MSDFGDGITAAEGIGILIVLYLLYKGVSAGASAVNNALTQAGAFATFSPGVPWVGGTSASNPALTNAPMSAMNARSIAMFIGVDNHGGSYTLSPNGLQIWFSDGSYYDNPSGHYFSSDGTDLGPLADNNQNTSTNMDTVDLLNLGPLADPANPTDPGNTAGLGG